MKNILTLFFIFISAICAAQFPNNPHQSSVNNNNIFDGAVTAQKGLVGGVFTDTTAANLVLYMKGVPGILIYTSVSNNYWFRNSTATGWLKVASGTAVGTVTSVGLTVPSPSSPAFSVSGSPVTGASTLAISALGTTGQYIRGDGSLATYGSASTVPINGLLAATGTNSIDNGNLTQTWSWNSLASNTGLILNTTANSDLSPTVLGVTMSGNNALQDAYGIYITGTKATNSQVGISSYLTGASTQNVAADFSASGGTSNIAAAFRRGTVNFGTSGTESGVFKIAGGASGIITIQPQAAAGTFNWNWPTTAGTSGQVLTSAGGVAAPMTWTTPSTATGTVTQVNALTLGTTGTDLSSSVANSTTTPTITLNVPTASATNRGALSAANWSTFYGKQDTTRIYGQYFNTTFPSTTLPSDMAKTSGAATYTQSSGMTVTGGDGNFNNNNLRSLDTSCSNNYDYIWDFTLNNKFTSHSSQGKWFGKKSTNTVNYNMYVNFKYGGSSSLARATLSFVSGTGNGTPVDSTGTISMADGNSYRVKITQIQINVIVKVSRMVAGVEVESVYINYKPPTNAALTFPNIGLAAMGSLDATSNITITNFKINYNDIVTPDAVDLGTSITGGFMPSSMNNHYLEKAFKGSNHTFANYGQGGNSWLTGLSALPRINSRLNPKYFIIEMGANDQGLAVADFRAYMQQYYDSIVTSYGKPMILLKVFANPTYDTIYYNFAAQHPTTVTLIDPASVLVSGDFVDGTHLNDHGNDIAASFCKAAVPSLFGSQVDNDQYTFQGLKDVSFASPANGDIPIYNSTTKKLENGTLGGTYIQNQTASPQTAGFNISGYGTIGTGAGVGGDAIVGVPLLVSQTATGGQGLRVQNLNAASAASAPYMVVTVKGLGGDGVTDWGSAGLVAPLTDGGLVLAGYAGTIKFQTGNSFTTRGTWNNTGLSIGTTSAPAEALDVTGNIKASSLAGTGTRGVTASSTGVLGTTVGTLTSVVATADSVALTATDTNVTSYTPGADGAYQVLVYSDITAISAATLTITCTFTDTHSNARTATFYGMGTTTAGIGALGSSNFPPIGLLSVKGGTAITVVATFAGVSIVYDVSAKIIAL